MSDHLYSPQYHQELLEGVYQVYQEFLEDLIEDLDQGYSSEVLSRDFLPQLKGLLQRQIDAPAHWTQVTWAHLIEQLVTIVQLHEEEDEEDEDYNQEEEIFDFWNQHEFSFTFMGLIEDGKSALEASLILIGLLENQILSFYAIHLDVKFVSDSPLLYSISKEFGDGDDRLYLQAGRYMCQLDTLQYEGLLPISRIDLQAKTVEVQDEQDVYLKSCVELPDTNTIQLSGKKITLLSHSPEVDERLELFKERIERALKLIHTFSPDCFQTFCSFSHTVIPVNEKGIVSYSLQSIPGVSLINMFDRDFVDLLDDLIHENGHHYLNAHLNQAELILEDDEQIFYSPWRRALRPIRGLYHAVFTFYWAAKLFGDLMANFDQLELDSQEKQKVALRFVEEYEMLRFTEPQIQRAFQEDKITSDGKALIDQVFASLDQLAPIYELALKKLGELESQHLELKEHLSKMSATYQLS